MSLALFARDMPLRSAVTQALQRAFRTHYYRQVRRRLSLMADHGVNLVLDVGANEGQFALELRGFGYHGRIVSFEPIASAFVKLSERAARDPLWTCEQIALGHCDGQSEINVSANGQSSSLLTMNPRLLESAPETRFIRKETVTVRRLDSIIPRVQDPQDVLYLKIDAQGFEKNVLGGAGDALDDITGLQVEVALVHLYNDAMLFEEMLEYAAAREFVLMGLEPEFSDPRTGQLLETDCIFFRQREANEATSRG